jgi:hypothetical protein
MRAAGEEVQAVILPASAVEQVRRSLPRRRRLLADEVGEAGDLAVLSELA